MGVSAQMPSCSSPRQAKPPKQTTQLLQKQGSAISKSLFHGAPWLQGERGVRGAWEGVRTLRFCLWGARTLGFCLWGTSIAVSHSWRGLLCLALLYLLIKDLSWHPAHSTAQLVPGVTS